MTAPRARKTADDARRLGAAPAEPDRKCPIGFRHVDCSCAAPSHTGGNAEEWPSPGDVADWQGGATAAAWAPLSDAPQEPRRPRGDAGAAHDHDRRSTATTGTPMRPEDVPGRILADALATWTGHDGDPLNDCDADDIETAATIIAAATPAIRAQVADEIEAAVPGSADPVTILRTQAMRRAARIARGDA